MPKTKFERIIFAFLSVVITVTLFVFYNISLEHGGMSNSVFKDSLNVFFIEFVFAFFLQIFIAGPLSMKITFRMVNPKEDKPFIVKNAIICYIWKTAKKRGTLGSITLVRQRLKLLVPVSARISIPLQKEKKIPIQVANLC